MLKPYLPGYIPKQGLRSDAALTKSSNQQNKEGRLAVTRVIPGKAPSGPTSASLQIGALAQECFGYLACSWRACPPPPRLGNSSAAFQHIHTPTIRLRPLLRIPTRLLTCKSPVSNTTLFLWTSYLNTTYLKAGGVRLRIPICDSSFCVLENLPSPAERRWPHYHVRTANSRNLMFPVLC